MNIEAKKRLQVQLFILEIINNNTSNQLKKLNRPKEGSAGYITNIKMLVQDEMNMLLLLLKKGLKFEKHIFVKAAQVNFKDIDDT
ncbi:hypothetical protein TNCV_919741 [Trichonephila clavipes]|nr:hypothetical protein TNCV_919741 [Trichonephila clavipes]